MFRAHNLTAIVVDDMHTILKLMKKVLTRVGFVSVECYDNGKKGLNALTTKHVDIVFSDLQMPVMSGPEMIKEFRAFEEKEISNGGRSRRQHVVGITAHYTAELNEELVSTGGFDSLHAKPIKLDDVNKMVSRYLAENAV